MLKNLFNKTFEILRSTESVSGGAVTSTWSVSSEVRGLKVPVVGFESFKYQKVTPEATDRLYVAFDADILKTDRVREKGTTTEFNVIDIKVSELGANKHQEVELKKVD